MHAFSLVTGSILGHEWAASVIGDAQRLVTTIRASHEPYRLLQDIAKASPACKATALQTSNTTRFTSVYQCIQSVLKMEVAFKELYAEHQSILPPAKG